MIYGYCRVSSKKQLEGNGMEVQKQEIQERYKDSGIKFIEEQYTGGSTDRPKFNKLFDKLEKGDILVVSKLDRLARNTIEGLDLVQKLFDKGVTVHVLNIGLLENTHMGKFFLTTLLAVAEMEKNTILERTTAGKEIAKQSADFREGRPKKFGKKQIEHAIEMLDEGKTYREVTELTGISRSTLARAVAKRKNDDKVAKTNELKKIGGDFNCLELTTQV